MSVGVAHAPLCVSAGPTFRGSASLLHSFTASLLDCSSSDRLPGLHSSLGSSSRCCNGLFVNEEDFATLLLLTHIKKTRSSGNSPVQMFSFILFYSSLSIHSCLFFTISSVDKSVWRVSNLEVTVHLQSGLGTHLSVVLTLCRDCNVNLCVPSLWFKGIQRNDTFYTLEVFLIFSFKIKCLVFKSI